MAIRCRAERGDPVAAGMARATTLVGENGDGRAGQRRRQQIVCERALCGPEQRSGDPGNRHDGHAGAGFAKGAGEGGEVAEPEPETAPVFADGNGQPAGIRHGGVDGGLVAAGAEEPRRAVRQGLAEIGLGDRGVSLGCSRHGHRPSPCLAIMPRWISLEPP